jgi:hypothetical protein
MAEILAISVNWHFGLANQPEIYALIDKWPIWRDLCYRFLPYATAGQGLYVAYDGAIASSYSYLGPGRGFGGAIISLTLEDGSTVDLRGPWDCGAGGTNKMLDQADYVTKAAASDDETEFKRGWTLCHTYLRCNAVDVALSRLRPDLEFVAYSATGDSWGSDDQQVVVNYRTHKELDSYAFTVRKKHGQVPSYAEALEYGDHFGFGSVTLHDVLYRLGAKHIDQSNAALEWVWSQVAERTKEDWDFQYRPGYHKWFDRQCEKYAKEHWTT